MPNTNRKRSRNEDARCWYEQCIAWDLLEYEGGISEKSSRDWQRFVIYDPTKKELVPALQEGHTGHPSEEQMERLYDAFEKGTLLFYPLGKNRPGRLVLNPKQDSISWNKIEVDKYRECPEWQKP